MKTPSKLLQQMKLFIHFNKVAERLKIMFPNSDGGVPTLAATMLLYATSYIWAFLNPSRTN